MDCEKGKISVIIPVYNTGGSGLLSRCLTSVLENNYRNIEVICVNDGSTDNSLDVLIEFSKKDERIVILNQANSGVSGARNAGLDVATGEYISFIDSDDFVHSECFSYLVSAVKTSNADIAVCKYQTVEDYVSDQPLNIEEHHIIKGEDFFGIKTPRWIRGFVWGRIYRTSMIADIRFSKDFSVMEDNLFNIEVVSNNLDSTIVLSNQNLYYRYIRPNSLSLSLDSIGFVELSKKFIQKTIIISNNLNPMSKKSILHESFKKALRLRYHVMYQPLEIKEEAERVLDDCYKVIINSTQLTFFERAYYYFLWRFPCIYRLYLISSDKSFLEAEKKRKNKKY